MPSVLAITDEALLLEWRPKAQRNLTTHARSLAHTHTHTHIHTHTHTHTHTNIGALIAADARCSVLCAAASGFACVPPARDGPRYGHTHTHTDMYIHRNIHACVCLLVRPGHARPSSTRLTAPQVPLPNEEQATQIAANGKTVWFLTRTWQIFVRTDFSSELPEARVCPCRCWLWFNQYMSCLCCRSSACDERLAGSCGADGLTSYAH